MGKDVEKGACVCLVDDRMGMVIMHWKDSKTLQTMNTFMDGVDCGDKHHVMGTGFSNVAHCYKWYKK
eukprot:6894659-Ditylum_brightwellii.AAC.1